MPRPRRISIPGYPHHVVQRGVNKQRSFFHEDDYLRYLGELGEAALKQGVEVHAFALMTNHVHLLLTPTSEDGMSLIMQSIGRSYVTYVNKRHERTGSLWEGRFKCSLVDTDNYCLACYRYIDLNPLRAAIVADPADYQWSSFRHNALGERCDFLTPHPTYLALGADKQSRLASYRRLIKSSLDSEDIRQIRFGIQKGTPVGSDRFREEIGRKIDMKGVDPS